MAAHRLSPVAEGRGYSLAAVLRLLIAAGSLVEEHGLWALGLSGQGRTGSVALQHAKSSWDRGQTSAPADGFITPGPPGKSWGHFRLT